MCLALCLSALIALASAPAADAGPWAREAGTAFVSAAAIATWPSGRALDKPDIYGTSYAEVGLGHGLTLGATFGTPDYGDPMRLKAVGFLRYTLTPPSAAHQFALDLGGGLDQGHGVLRVGASLGRGLELRGQGQTVPGWISADAAALFQPDTRQTHFAVDVTFGVSQRRTKYMAHLSASQSYDAAAYVTLTPSIAHQISDGLHIEMGVSVGLKNKPDPELKLGIWREF